MTDSLDMTAALEARARRRDDRRGFFKTALGAAAVGVAGAATLGLSGEAAAQSATVTDADVLNFALNLEYLEAQFYSYAVNGVGLSNSLLTGTGTQGAATGARAVNFGGDATVSASDAAIIGNFAREIAADEAAHVAFLRSALGTSAIAQPTIDLSVGPNSAFSKAAAAAGLIAAGGTFDPYASVQNFLYAAFLFEDVGVTAYKGASTLLTSKVYLEAAAGILAAEAYHAAIVREELYRLGLSNAAIITQIGQISDARDALDGQTDIDQGIAETTTTITNADNTTTTLQVAHIVPADANAIAYSRTPGQVLNIAYLTSAQATSGGFFPNGVNGNVKQSAASA
ncbi:MULTISPECIES: ferritin-like domain-containing protein [unclassified Sphingomonas]|jgi:Ferritin-like domain|uniref:ferritin-like domain-containing protein n=1 Tax=unclassified Sphingomonas TaxID=196159 RepID=UPI000E10003B|nr:MULTISPECIES: ferritin-like domain-containing protein [unclassified Sphingomonas]AXJ95144.1 ferritin-like domain-containing protein [Sphingomonas sp. FARSPH]